MSRRTALDELNEATRPYRREQAETLVDARKQRPTLPTTTTKED